VTLMERKKKNPKVIVRLETVNCAQCGVSFSLPEHLNTKRREDGQAFTCPNGHSNVYKKSTIDTLKEQIAALEKERDTLKTELLHLKHKLEQAGIP
jgi:hypothetical protein